MSFPAIKCIFLNLNLTVTAGDFPRIRSAGKMDAIGRRKSNQPITGTCNHNRAMTLTENDRYK